MKKNINKEFSRIYEDNLVSIYKYIYGRVWTYLPAGRKEKAEDLTADTFLTAYEKFLACRQVGKDLEQDLNNPKTWLIQIARNKMGNEFQKKKDLPASKLGLNLNEDFNLSDFKTSELNIQVKKSDVKIIKAELKKLKPEIQEIINLKLWQELTFKEISEIVGKNQKAVEQTYRRGILKIRKRINKKDKRALPIVLVGLNKLSAEKEFLTRLSFAKSLISKFPSGISELIKISSIKNMVKTLTILGKTITTKALITGIVATTVGLGIVGMGGVYYYQSQKDDYEVQEEVKESETKECSSEKVGIKMQIPTDWSCEETENPEERLIVKSDYFKIKFKDKGLGDGLDVDEMPLMPTEHIYEKLPNIVVIKHRFENHEPIVQGIVSKQVENQGTKGVTIFRVVYQNMAEEDIVSEEMVKLTKVLDSIEILEEENIKEVEVEGDEDIENVKTGSEIISLNSTWDKYVNYDLGFEIKVPKTVITQDKCYKNSNNLYDVKFKQKGIKVFDNNLIKGTELRDDEIYISHVSHGMLDSELMESDKCFVVDVSWEFLHYNLSCMENGQCWFIKVETVDSKEEVVDFLKSYYGKGTNVKEFIETKQEGVFKIDVEPDLARGETNPKEEYLVVKYDSKRGILVMFDTFESNIFNRGPGYRENSYDQEMIDSFRFL